MMPMSDCVLWEGYVNKQGYGWVTRRGTQMHIHRYLYEQEHGPQPGLHIHHSCGNRRCINLEHLIAVTPQEHHRLDQGRRTHCRRGHSYAEHGKPERGTARRCTRCHAGVHS